jgi:hypothetical protein
MHFILKVEGSWYFNAFVMLYKGKREIKFKVSFQCLGEKCLRNNLVVTIFPIITCVYRSCIAMSRVNYGITLFESQRVMTV